MKKDTTITQYYSKWRKCWVNFKDSLKNDRIPNEVEIKEMRKFNYKLR